MSRMSLRSGQELRAKPPHGDGTGWRWALGERGSRWSSSSSRRPCAVVKLQPSGRRRSRCRQDAAAAPSGQLDGTWRVTAGSVAGFRVRETFSASATTSPGAPATSPARPW